MNLLANVKIAQKLIGSSMAIALLGFAIGLFGYTQIHKLDELDTRLYEEVTVPLNQLAQISIDFQRARINLRDGVNATEEKEKREAYDMVAKMREEITQLAARFENTITNAEERALFQQFKSARKSYGDVIDRVIAFDNANKDVEALALVHGDGKTAALSEQDAINRLMDHKLGHAKSASQENKRIADETGRVMLGLAVLGTLLSALVGWIISRSISEPMAQLAREARRIAEGDLTVDVASERGDEVGQLAGSFNHMTENLRRAIGQVADTAGEVAAASGQLHSTSHQIATGAEQMLAQAQNVATASEEMTATANEIAASCQRAANGARDAVTSADAGVAVVENTVKVMNRIAERVKNTAGTVVTLGERSNQIGVIVGTIENIAAQTNLLALNAAIEAARAGEMGRGFAVVADEVRALAARTTAATSEIGEMIRSIQGETKLAVGAMEESVREVDSGTGEAARSGAALRDIVEQVNAVTLQISQVASAAEEQTATTTEMSSNIHQITQVVEATARGAQDSAESAEQLSRNATQLSTLVGKFRI